jgi:two-component system sensor histidine kinase EvgS
VTANAQPEAVTEAIAAGMTLCLVKPLGLDRLRHALELAVRDARASKASTAPMVVATSDSSPAVNPASRVKRASNASVMHVSTAATGSARHSAQACAYGPTRNFPSNIVARRAVLPAPGAPGFYPGQLNGEACGHSDTTRESIDSAVPESGDSNGATVKAASASGTVPRFSADQLNGFGNQAAALVEALQSANRQDLDEARRAFGSGDFCRLRDLAHRMKGAAFVIGATSFANACLNLQRACAMLPGQGCDHAAIRTAYDHFHDEARALDTALEQHPT